MNLKFEEECLKSNICFAISIYRKYCYVYYCYNYYCYNYYCYNYYCYNYYKYYYGYYLTITLSPHTTCAFLCSQSMSAQAPP